MKVLPNGGLNLSVRDGWWAEAYEPGVGWAIGVDADGMDEGQQDALDAGQLYDTLERQVVPLYYDRGPDGIPHGWIAMVKNSMRRLCPQFNTNRMVRQYVEEHYLPAARRYRKLTADHLAPARSLAAWEAAVRTHWNEVRIEQASAHRENGTIRFQARAYLGALHPEDVVVQAYADPLNGAAPDAAPMQLKPAGDGTYLVEGQISSPRPPSDFTLRVLPQHPEAHEPLDLPLVVWEH
jgi:glycogen phosphorylase